MTMTHTHDVTHVWYVTHTLPPLIIAFVRLADYMISAPRVILRYIGHRHMCNWLTVMRRNVTHARAKHAPPTQLLATRYGYSLEHTTRSFPSRNIGPLSEVVFASTKSTPIYYGAIH